MKVRLSFSFFFLFFLLSLCAFSQRSYDITFNIEGLLAKQIVIKSYYGKDKIVIDTLNKDENNNFHLKKDSIFPSIAMVYYQNYELFTFLFGKDTSFTINIDMDWNFHIENSKDNDLYFEYQKENTFLRLLYSQIKETQIKDSTTRDSLIEEYSKKRNSFILFQKDFFQNYPNHILTKIDNAFKQVPLKEDFFIGEKIDTTKRKEIIYYIRKNFWNNFNFSDSIFMGTPQFFNHFKRYISEATIQRGDSIAESLKDFIVMANNNGGELYSKYVFDYMIEQNIDIPFAYNEDRMVEIVDRVVNDSITPFVSPSQIMELRIKADRIRPLLVGKKFSNFSEKDFSNKTHNLYDIKSRYTIVYFWAAGCESCKKDIDILKNFYKNYHKIYDFEIYSIDLNEDLSQSIEFNTKTPFSWIVVKTTPEEIMKKYNLDISLTPDIYILDEEKRIVNHTPLYSQVIKTIKQLISLDKEKED